jgi:uncharacterized small protein (DUF1192 family)
MTLKDRLVDPIHFFNSEAVPILTLKELEKRNADLENQVLRLTRMLKAQVEKNKLSEPAADTPKLNS